MLFYTRSIYLFLIVENVYFVEGYGFEDDYEYPRTMYFRQKWDHFDPTSNATYLQRYLISTKNFKPNGPVFFYCGNEDDITVFVNNTGFVWEIAPIFGAMVIFAEHRYYGDSTPYQGLEPSRSNAHKFAQLTVEQALADYAELITHLKQTIRNAKKSAVIAFGGSYGGMLAAWLRRKYPHIVDGALASSALVANFPGLVNCLGPRQVVTSDFAGANGGLFCVANIRKTWSTILNVSMQPSGYRTLEEVFRLCNGLKNIEHLNNWIEKAWEMLAMLDYPYPTNFLHPLPAWPVQKSCERVSTPHLHGLDLLAAVRDAVGVFYNHTGKKICYSINSKPTIGLLSKTWDFQTCTELPMPVCSDGIRDMFKPKAWTLKKFTKDCKKKYGVTPQPKWATLQFGGRNWKYESNIIFSNGDLDPWKVGGIHKSYTKSIKVLRIKDAAHHLDLRGANPKDPVSVVKARNAEIETIAEWVDSVDRDREMQRRSYM